MLGKFGARAIRSTFDNDPFEVLAYRGYGNRIRTHVYGRAQEVRNVSSSLHQPDAQTRVGSSERRNAWIGAQRPAQMVEHFRRRHSTSLQLRRLRPRLQ